MTALPISPANLPRGSHARTHARTHHSDSSLNTPRDWVGFHRKTLRDKMNGQQQNDVLSPRLEMGVCQSLPPSSYSVRFGSPWVGGWSTACA